MRRTKSLLNKIEIEVARGKRTCKNSRRAIEKGERCLVVFDGQQKRAGYSSEVGLRMIDEAEKALVALREELSGS